MPLSVPSRSPSNFAHHLVDYETPDDLAELIDRTVDNYAGSDTPSMLVVDDHVASLLGSRTTDSARVEVLPTQAFYKQVWQTYAHCLASIKDRSRTAGQMLAVISPPVDVRPADVWSQWVVVESMFNQALADTNAVMICPYKKSAAELSWTSEIANVHPSVIDASGTVSVNARYLDTDDFLTERHKSQLTDLGAPTFEMAFAVSDLAEVRERVNYHCINVGIVGERNDEIVIVVNELVTNSIRHGGGSGWLRIWERPATLICDVHDSGHLSNIDVGMVPPSRNGESGRGVWIARQLCDVLEIAANSSGTTVRMRAS